MNAPGDDQARVREPGSGPRSLAAAVWGLVLLYAVGLGVSSWWRVQAHAAHAPPEVSLLAWMSDEVFVALWLAAFAAVGATVISRRPREPIGWVLFLAASALAVMALANGYAGYALDGSPADPPVLGLVAAWVGSWPFVLFVVLAMVFLPLLYPDGRLPSPRWRPLAWTAAAVVPVFTVRGLLSERLTGTVHPAGAEPVEVFDVANPLAASWVGWLDAVTSSVAFEAVIAGLFVAAFAAVVVRFRRSRGVERQQMKWFLLVPVGLILIVAVTLGAVVLFGGDPAALTPLPLVLFGGYPVGVGVAVLRYRLYEIDRIISRTVTYGLVVVVLGAVYVAGVVGLGAVASGFAGERESDLAVAASVLAVVALFRPVRTRVQRTVDRRFNRTGYEARRTVEAFGQRVRDDVELEAITRGVAETAAVAVQPAHVSLWISDGGEDGS